MLTQGNEHGREQSETQNENQQPEFGRPVSPGKRIRSKLTLFSVDPVAGPGVLQPNHKMMKQNLKK